MVGLLTPELFIVGVRSAFRIGREVRNYRRDQARLRPFNVVMGDLGTVNLEEAALNHVCLHPDLSEQFKDLFPSGRPQLTKDVRALKSDRLRQAIECGARSLLGDKFSEVALDKPLSLDEASNVFTMTPLLSLDGKLSRRRRFAWTLVDIALEAVAAQPNVIGLKGDAEKLMGGLAMHLDVLLPEPEDQLASDVAPWTFNERAMSVFAQATLQTLADNADIVASESHYAALLKATVTPLADEVQRAGASGELPALAQLRRCLCGPVARSVLQTLSERQIEFLGQDFSPNTPAGAVTAQVLHAALDIEKDNFDVMRAFSPAGLSLVYNSALDAAAQHPELFIKSKNARGETSRELLRGVAEAMQGASFPFSPEQRLGDKLANVAIDVGLAHASRLLMAEHAGEDPWDVVSRGIIQQTLSGFAEACHGLVDMRAAGPAAAATQRANPFERLFNMDQAVSIVRVIAAQAAQTPGMVTGEGAKSEVKDLAKAVATFLADPETRLASSQDWMMVVGVLVEEVARNPDTLIARSAGPRGAEENYLAVHLMRVLMASASAAMTAPMATAAAGASSRKRGVVLFGDTLREAAIATLRAGADNAAALLDDKSHIEALQDFVGRLQSLQPNNRALGAGEWLWLYKRFVAHVIVFGADAPVTDDELLQALETGPAGLQGRTQ